MTTFEQFQLSTEIMRALNSMQFTQPTPIQTKAIPSILDHKDLLASSQTGTGKTAAFCIPTISQLAENPQATCLILTPTRELAMQVFKVCESLTQNIKSIRAGLFIGGIPIHKQISHLKSKPRLFIATPGRIIDLLERKELDLSKVEHLILDETDRMLDMGFGDQIKQIMRFIPKKRQTLLFSATIPKEIENLSQKYLEQPIRIQMEVNSKPADNLIQDVKYVRADLKFDMLVEEIQQRQGTIIVFTKTKRGADKVAKNLGKKDIQARSLHGDLKQSVRQRIIDMYRKQKFRVLVATDVAARGLDIDHVEHVVNFDIPQQPQDYIHRIGRTARAGAKGHALSLVAPIDENLWRMVERFLKSDGSESYQRPKKRSGRKGKSKRGSSRFYNVSKKKSSSRSGDRKQNPRNKSKSTGPKKKTKSTQKRKQKTYAKRK